MNEWVIIWQLPRAHSPLTSTPSCFILSPTLPQTRALPRSWSVPQVCSQGHWSLEVFSAEWEPLQMTACYRDSYHPFSIYKALQYPEVILSTCPSPEFAEYIWLWTLPNAPTPATLAELNWHLFDKRLLRMYYDPGIVLFVENTAECMTDMGPAACPAKYEELVFVRVKCFCGSSH